MLLNKKFSQSTLARLFLLVMVVSFNCFSSFSQDPVEKKDPLLNISYYKLNNNSLFAKINAKYKEERNFIPIAAHEVKLYFNESGPANLIGKGLTNAKGEVRVIFDENYTRLVDSAANFSLVAEVDSTLVLNSASETLAIENVIVEFTTEELDSTKMMKATVFKKNGNAKIPAEGIELNFYVARSFGMIPLSPDPLTTDASGNAELEFSSKMPGDSSGHLTLAVKLAGLDTYGTVANFQEQPWGKKVLIDSKATARAALWASRANVPIWLLIASNGIILAVWGTIIYLVLQIFKIKKLGREEV